MLRCTVAFVAETALSTHQTFGFPCFPRISHRVRGGFGFDRDCSSDLWACEAGGAHLCPNVACLEPFQTVRPGVCEPADPIACANSCVMLELGGHLQGYKHPGGVKALSTERKRKCDQRWTSTHQKLHAFLRKYSAGRRSSTASGVESTPLTLRLGHFATVPRFATSHRTACTGICQAPCESNCQGSYVQESLVGWIITNRLWCNMPRPGSSLHCARFSGRRTADSWLR